MIDTVLDEIVDDLPFARTLLERMQTYDPLTYAHLKSVSLFAYQIAGALNTMYHAGEGKSAELYELSETDRRRIAQSGLLHDIGKLFIPTEILNAPRRLQPSEWRIIRQHAEQGEALISKEATKVGPGARRYYDRLGRIILHHHERWDGSGYPYGLMGQMIPLESRIIGIVDAYDALISGRPYLRAIHSDHALQRIFHEGGHAFDAAIVPALFATIGKGAILPTPHPHSHPRLW